MNWNKQDLLQFTEKGISQHRIEQQLSAFSRGMPWIRLHRAATVGDGIRRIKGDELQEYVHYYEANLPETIVKFVPASGAASRMFKALFTCEQELQLKGDVYLNTLEAENPEAYRFFSQLDQFPFYLYLEEQIPKLAKIPLQTAERALAILQWLLYEGGLAYGSLPKGLLDFHRYGQMNRTAFEEHLVEGAAYAQNARKQVRIHFTVSPEHKEGFRVLQEAVVQQFEKDLDVSFQIEYSTQDPSTDTLAVNPDNTPFRDAQGRMVFRPGGHGALIHNLQQIQANLIFVKNIDNVVPDRMKQDTTLYKKLLAGVLLEIQQKAFAFLHELDQESPPIDLPRRITSFVKESLFMSPPDDLFVLALEEQFSWCRTMLDRPLRVCGMVKNEGEPGGGPFFVQEADGNSRLQIVEKAQINVDDPHQAEILSGSTHFNPVDLVCSTRNYKGEPFDLADLVDGDTAFISHKSKDGRELKALELPGLWNGAMARWNTLFVEVPLTTFNPVKTITDLLRPQHQ